MSPRLSKQRIISRDDLVRIAEERLRESEVLLEHGCHAGSVYLGGYAVECFLKAAICRRLSWNHLLGVFKTHDLEALLLYSGVASELEDEMLKYENFRQVVGLWNDRNGEAVVRYRDPLSVDESTARKFHDCLVETPEGLIPWLPRVTS